MMRVIGPRRNRGRLRHLLEILYVACLWAIAVLIVTALLIKIGEAFQDLLKALDIKEPRVIGW